MPGLDIGSPISLARACAGYNVLPGDVLVLRAGTYSLDFVNKMIGGAPSHVTVMPYNNERVIVNGNWNDQTSTYVDYVDLEFTAPLGDRVVNSMPASLPCPDFRGTGSRIINCILHDTFNVGAWDNVDLFYGCITYNHGLIVNGTPYGHSLYMQNQSAGHLKTIKHSIFGSSANFGLHGYATDFNLTNITVNENVLLPFPNVPDSRHLIGSLSTDDGITYTNNHSYGLVQLGYAGDNHTDLTMTGNRMYAPDVAGGRPFTLNHYASGDIENNIVVMGTSGGSPRDILVYGAPSSPGALTIDNNTYYNRSGKSNCFNDDGTGRTLAQWQTAHSFDANSTITLDGSSPVDSSHVYPNEFASISKRKGLVVIWNWTGAASVSVDLTTIPIAANAAMKVINCEDPIVDIVSTTMPANKIYSVPMTGHTVAQVTGWAARPTAFPTLGAFMIEV